jgi:multidrug transporter EmrE-like cation transporter
MGLAKTLLYEDSISQLRDLSKFRLKEFEDNTLLFASKESINIPSEIANQFEDSLLGVNFYYNVIIVEDQHEFVRVLSDFTFDDKYIKLYNGRMPDTSKNSSTFVEAIGISEAGSFIGQTKKLTLKNPDTDETHVVNCSIVGITSIKSFPYPISNYSGVLISYIIPDISVILGFDIIRKTDCAFYTFSNSMEKDKATSLILMHSGNNTVMPFTTADGYLTANIESLIDQQKQTSIQSIVLCVISVLSVFAVQNLIFNSCYKKATNRSESIKKIYPFLFLFISFIFILLSYILLPICLAYYIIPATAFRFASILIGAGSLLALLTQTLILKSRKLEHDNDKKSD